ncbi:MAG: dipeptidase PepE [Mangrovimonas sp.]|nr:dipeptidase PepE [Mangrovimonas sp.]
MKRLFIASTSTLHGGTYLEYLIEPLSKLYSGISEILFIPYARPGGISYKDYTAKVQDAFSKLNIKVTGLQDYENPVLAIKEAQGIFVGGGNTFVLVNQLYKENVMEPLRNAVKNGTPYLGTSAGSNICGLTMQTTNDMPIAYPPSFKTLGLVPFNINPHYLDPDANSLHMGETRETRIKEFHSINSQPVIGLREGSWLDVNDTSIVLKGKLKARIFEAGKEPYEVLPETNLSTLK